MNPDAVCAVLVNEESGVGCEASVKKDSGDIKSLVDDPWQGLLGDEE